MPQVLRPEFIGSITKLSSTQISIDASNVIIGGQQYNTSAITVSTNGAGLNGLDTGTITANQFYYIFLVKSGLSVGGVISLNSTPTGFSAYKLVGQCTTQSASTSLEAANNAIVDATPIGQIMSAMLTEAQFRAIHGPGWILADGRTTGVASSKYGLLTAATSVPDLRGMVLRGKNNSRADGDQDPSGERVLGSLQGQATAKNGLINSSSAVSVSGNKDQFNSNQSTAEHSHALTNSVYVASTENFGGGGNQGEGANNGIVSSTTTSGGHNHSWTGSFSASGTASAQTITGDTETRMRNVAVNHFIKIN